MRWCPQCEIEHEDWAFKCSDCNVQLVDELPIGRSDQIDTRKESKKIKFIKEFMPNGKTEKFFLGQIAAIIIAYIIYFILIMCGIPVAQHISFALLFIMSLISLVATNSNVSLIQVLQDKKISVILGVLILPVVRIALNVLKVSVSNLTDDYEFFLIMSGAFSVIVEFLFIFAYLILLKIFSKDKMFPMSNLSKKIFIFMVIGITALFALNYIGQIIYFNHFMKNNFTLTIFDFFSEDYSGILTGFDNLIQYLIIFSVSSFVFFRRPVESNEQSTNLQKFFVWQLCAIAATIFCSVLINFISQYTQLLFENMSNISTIFTLLISLIIKGFVYFVPSIYILYSLKNNIRLKDAIKLKPVKTSLTAIIVLFFTGLVTIVPGLYYLFGIESMVSFIASRILSGIATAAGYILIYKFLSNEKLEMFRKNFIKRNLIFFGIILLVALILSTDVIIAIAVMSTAILIYLSNSEKQEIKNDDLISNQI